MPIPILTISTSRVHNPGSNRNYHFDRTLTYWLVLPDSSRSHLMLTTHPTQHNPTLRVGGIDLVSSDWESKKSSQGVYVSILWGYSRIFSSVHSPQVRSPISPIPTSILPPYTHMGSLREPSSPPLLFRIFDSYTHLSIEGLIQAVIAWK